VSGDHPRNIGPMLASPRRSQDPFRRLLSVAGGVQQKTLPDAWRRAGFRRAEAEPKRPEARRIYETGY
jgi:hypothetical protein